ncbi:MATE family efflux transporter [Actinomyces sp. 2119]|uniref:MATE family efflux transporter n=1 Tax=Actinomyces sp. 2119 TaxID=2321393 RepID=UPI000E6B98B1|nr:MATE family efflux transporter [Actinomyces sp. 2119]
MSAATTVGTVGHNDTVHAAPTVPSLNRRILSLAVPALGALVAEPVFVLIDSAMVGHLGTASLAGLSLASTVLTTTVGLFVFLAYATTATTARLLGAGRQADGLRAGLDGIWLGLVLGAAGAVALAATAPWLVEAMGAQAQVAQAARSYLWASAPGLPGMLVVLAATGTLRGLLDTRTPFVVAAAGALLNVVLNAALVYGLGLGIVGSGAGTALAQTLMALALVRPLVRAARARGVPVAPRRAGLRASLGNGLPLLVRTLSLRTAILVTVWAATAQGPTALAAHQVVTAVWNLAAFALDALAIAAQALVGTSLGQAEASRASQPAPARGPSPGAGTEALADPQHGRWAETSREEAIWQVDDVLRRTLAWGVVTGTGIGMVVAVSSPWLPRLFTSESAVVLTAVPSLLVAASAMPLAGAVYLFDGVLMGAGDGRYLARAGLMTLVPYVPLAIVVSRTWPADDLGSSVPAPGLLWLWVAFAWVFMGARAVTTGLRTRGSAWRR